MGGSGNLEVTVERPARPKIEESRHKAWLWTALAVVVVATISSLVTPSYDEVFWIAVTRSLSNGGTLYDTVLDNKGPLWYVVYTALDLPELPFNITRAFVLLGLGGLFVGLSGTLLKRHGVSQPYRSILAAMAFVIAAFSSRLHLTVELGAAALILGSLVAGTRYRAAASACVAAAILIDPRAILFVPSVFLYVRNAGRAGADSSRNIRIAAALVPVAALGAFSVYVVHPDLRFAVFEVGWETRPIGLASFTFYSTVVAATTSPMLVLTGTIIRPARLRLPGSAWWFAGAAVLVAVVSVAPSTHYWTYLPLTLALLVPGRGGPVGLPALWASYAAVSLIPLVVLTVVVARSDHSTTIAHETAFDSLRSTLDPADQIVILALTPHVMAEFSEQILNDSPVPYDLLLNTSRRESYLRRFATDVMTADAVWVHSREIPPSSRKADPRLWQLIEGRAPHLRCHREIPPFVVLETPQGVSCSPSVDATASAESTDSRYTDR